MGTLKAGGLHFSILQNGYMTFVRSPAGVLPHTTSTLLLGVVAAAEAATWTVSEDELWAIDRFRSSDALLSLLSLFRLSIVTVDASTAGFQFFVG